MQTTIQKTMPTSIFLVFVVIPLCIFHFFLVDKTVYVDSNGTVGQDDSRISNPKPKGDKTAAAVVSGSQSSVAQGKHNITHIKVKYTGDQDLDRIVEAAQSMSNKPVLISLVNDAFLRFVFSWLCNTKDMGIHKQVLLITTDFESKKKVKEMWPEVQIVVISVSKTMQGGQRYSRAGYVRLVIRRTQILQALLENGIETLLFEVDCAWLKNSIPFLHSHAGKYDMILNEVTGKPRTIAGGFLYLFPTNRTIEVFKELNRMLRKLETKIQNMARGRIISQGDNDQVYLSGLVFKKYAGINFKVLPVSEFGDGKWYMMSREKRKASYPYLINFNWIIDNNKKISRAKKFGHWFINGDNTCDNDQVKKTVHGMAKSHS